MRAGILILLLGGLTAGQAVAQGWVQKIAGPGLGNPLTANPLNDDVLYAAAGSNRIYVSRDRGYTWANHGALVTGGGIVKSVSVSPLDTLQMLAGMESSTGSPDRIMKTTDGGLTWTQTWSGTFSYFGQPVEFSPLHPDTVYTMGLDTLYRSIDFGSTWDTVATGPGFNAWCDASIRPDSAGVIYVGDNLSGIWKTTDHGVNWRKVYATIGEIPSIAIDPLNPRVAYAGKFGGGGGLVRTTNWGETWHTLPVPSGNRDTWWVTCSPVHPGYVYYGTYTGDSLNLGIYLSRDSGASWTKINQGLPSGAIFNYGLLTLDSLTLLALQSSGLFKYQYPTAIDVLVPDGGEYWLADSAYQISWSSTGLYYLRLEYSVNGGASWTLIADSIPSSQSSYLWTTPQTFSQACRIRISDRLWTATADTSGASFTITDAFLTLLSPNGGEAWDAGSFREVSWSSVSFDSLAIDLSTDGGSGWTFLSEVPAAAGAFPWQVPDLPTTQALIRLRGTDDTNVVDLSDGVFSILSGAEFTAPVVIADAGAGVDTLRLGNAAGATSGIDTAFGEAELGPPPGPGAFDVRWLVDGTEGTALDLRDTLSPADPTRTFRARLQPGPGGHPFTLSWPRDSLRRGTFVLRDAGSGGGLVHLNMRRDSAVTVVDPSVGELEILQCPGVPVEYPGTGSWMLISLPVDAGTRRTAQLFPFSPGGAFAYRNGYVKRDTLAFGEGYWIKAERTTVTGCPVTPETVRVRQGWNIVGSLAEPFDPASLISIPESLVTSPFYGFGPSGYVIADSLRPGEGYWAKCRDSGVLILGGAAAGRFSAGAEGIGRDGRANTPRGDLIGSLSIAAGEARGTLYFGPGIPHGGFEAPPQPPGGGESISFQNGKIGAFHPITMESPLDIEIRIPAGEKRIFFSPGLEIQDYFDYILVEKSGASDIARLPLRGGGVFGVESAPGSIFSLRVAPRRAGGAGVPATFSMGECYPNPFNPSTRFSFSLPSRSVTSYSVFNVLGERVSSSAPAVLPAGGHEAEWSARRDDGTPLGSGAYFIVLTAVSAPETGPEDAGAMTHRAVRKVLLVR